MTDNTIQQVQRVSRAYVVFFDVLLAVIPIVVLVYWAFFNQLPEGFHAELPVQPGQVLSLTQKIFGGLVSLLPLSVVIYGLVTLKALFRLYAKGIMFSIENVKYFRRLGYALIAWVMANTLYTPLISLVVSSTSPHGERVLVAQFGITDLLTFLIGGIILVISWVMNEGRKLEDEQAFTV